MGPVYILAAALIVALIALIGIKVARMISREGFQTMKNLNDLLVFKTSDISIICPNNGVVIGRVTVPNLNIDTAKTILSKAFTDPLSILKEGTAEIAWACYPPGITNMNPIFQSDPATSPSGVMILGPRGTTIDLYSEKDAKGTLVKTISDYTSSIVKGCPPDTVCSDSVNFRNLQFASVKITLDSKITPPPIITPPSKTCPTLSPAAAAAAAAAEAKEKANTVKAAAIADATSKAISKSIMNSIEDSSPASVNGDDLGSNLDGNMMSVTCPSGDKPKISFVRNTKNANPETVDVNTLTRIKPANIKPSASCPESSPASVMGNGTGGGYYFDPEKDC